MGADNDFTSRRALRWVAPLLNYSGYASGARYFPTVLSAAGVQVQAVPFDSDPRYIAEMSVADSRWWLDHMGGSVSGRPCTVMAAPVSPFGDDLYRMFRAQHKDCSHFLGYLAWETPRLPDTWVDACLHMDEIWVPSRFCREAFLAGGMPGEQVHTIPIGIDFDHYDPASVKPLTIPGARGFVFLSVFEWSLRKGWDVLLRAYHQAFTAGDEVTLAIRSYRRGRDQRWIEAQIRAFEDTLAIPAGRRARVVLVDRFVPETHMASLYAAADAYVLPSRGEGWGKPYVEAMAMERPTVGSGWGGNLDFMHEGNSFLVPCRELPVPRAGWGDNPNAYHYRGHVWAEPDADVLARQLRAIVEDPDAARAKARRARAELRQWLAPERIAAAVEQRLERVQSPAADCGLIPRRLLCPEAAETRKQQADTRVEAGAAEKGVGVLLVGRPDLWQHIGEDSAYLWSLQQRLEETGTSVAVSTRMTPDAGAYQSACVVGGRDALTLATQVASVRATCAGPVVLIPLPAARARAAGTCEWPESVPDAPSDPSDREATGAWLRAHVPNHAGRHDADLEDTRLERLARQLADVVVVHDTTEPSSERSVREVAPPVPMHVKPAARADAGAPPLVVVGGAMTRNWSQLLLLHVLGDVDVRVEVLLRTQDAAYAALCRQSAPAHAVFIESTNPEVWAQQVAAADLYIVPGAQAAADPLRYMALKRGATVVMPADCPDLATFGDFGFGFPGGDADAIRECLKTALGARATAHRRCSTPAPVDEIIASALSDTGPPDARALALARMLIAKARNQYDRVEQVVAQTGEALRADPEWQLIFGELLLKLGQSKAARQCFEAAARLQSHAAVAARRLAHVALFEGDYPRARALLEQVLKQHPDDRRCLQDLGEIALLQNQAADAAGWLAQVQRSEPDNLVNLIHLADAQRLAGDRTAATDTYGRALRLDGNLSQVVARLLEFNLDKVEPEPLVAPDSEAAPEEPSSCATSREPFGVNVIGHISGNLGIGVTARSVVQALLDRGIPVATIDIDPGMGRAGADRRFDQLAVQSFEALPHPVTIYVLPPASIAAIHKARPDFFERVHMNVGFSMWELPGVPPAWIPALEALDILVAESEFIRYAFQFSLSGVEVLSAAHPLYLPRDVCAGRALFGLPEDGVLFLSSFEPNSDVARKNPEAVIEAFLQGVGDDRRAHLVLKLNNADVGGKLHPSVAALRLHALRHPRIHILTDTLSYEDVLSLYASCDVFVSLHRAEGLGLALLECMALGKPVIATGWSGNLSFMDHTCACLVGYRLIPVDGTIPAYQAVTAGVNARWADPKVSEAADWMRRLMADPALRAELGARARSRAEEYTARAARLEFMDEIARIWSQREFAAGGSRAVLKPTVSISSATDYANWLQTRDVRPSELQLPEELAAGWKQEPWFHVVTTLAPGQEDLLAQTLDSLGDQIYGGWKLTVFAMTAAPDESFSEDPRLQWRQLDSAHARCDLLNEVAASSDCDWLLSLPPGDRLDPRALLAFGDLAERKPQAKLLYCDEDALDENGGRAAPAFKPDFNVDLLRSWPYLGEAVVIRRQALLDLKGYQNLPGAEAYDLALRLWERDREPAFVHVPKILAHACSAERRGDDVAKAIDSGLRAVQMHLARIDPAAAVESGPLPGTHRVRYGLACEPLVSIIIPTRNAKDLLAACVESLQENTAYRNFELLVVDNGSDESDAQAYLEGLPKRFSNARVLRYAGGYNFSAINNFAAHQASGEFLLLLNNDTGILHADWLHEMVGCALRADVGVVGARLLFPGGRVQHAGVVLGMGANGVAEHPCLGFGHDEPGYLGRAQVTQEVSAVTGACLLIRKSLYQQIGGLDERHLPVMYNDIDLCLKARELGAKVIWTPFATLMHHGSASLKDRQYSDEERQQRESEIALMLERWPRQLAGDPFYNRNLSLKNGACALDLEIATGWDRERQLRPRILGMGFGSDGSWQHRVVQPLHALEACAGAETGLLPKYKDRVRVPSVSELVREKPDVVLLHNCVHDTHLEALQRYRRFTDIFLVFGQDDLMFQLPPGNPFHGKVYKDMKARLRRAIGLCDRLVVTTEPLAEAYRDMAAEIVLQPNYLPTGIWSNLQSRRRRASKPRVGWAGAQQHVGDLALVLEVVKATAREVDWVFFGLCFEELLPYVAEVVDPVPFHRYPQTLAGLDLDLAIAPLEQNRFNQCKSNLKVLEYGALGIPVVCTDIEPYRGAPVTTVRNRNADWLEAIRARVHDLDSAAREGDRLRQWVYQHWMLEPHLGTWLAALMPSPDSREATVKAGAS